ncbi:MAG: uroporphyrinogen-III synthase [Gemmatimonadaceae bacterium]
MGSQHEPGRLQGRRIAVTRVDEQGVGGLSDRLAALGADVLAIPLTRIEPVNPALLRDALTRLAAGGYDWVVFSSRNGVRLTCEALWATTGSLDALRAVRLAAVGAATAERLVAEGLAVAVIPERFLAEGLVEAMASRDDVRGRRVLYPAAEGARDVIPEGLAALGATVDVVSAYRSTSDPRAAAAVRAAIEEGPVDLVTFAAPSAVHAWIAALGPEQGRRVPGATIGSVTSAAAREAGIPVVVEAEESTIPGLVAAITHHYEGQHV